MAYTVMTNVYGLYSHGPYSHGLCSDGLYSYGQCSYGLYSYGRQGWVATSMRWTRCGLEANSYGPIYLWPVWSYFILMARTVMGCIVMAYIFMAYIAMPYAGCGLYSYGLCSLRPI